MRTWELVRIILVPIRTEDLQAQVTTVDHRDLTHQIGDTLSAPVRIGPATSPLLSII